MITEQLVHSVIEHIQDHNAYRIASYIAYLGHAINHGDMNAIRDILGEAHPDLRDDGKVREPQGRRFTSRNHIKRDERVKGGAA